ncbi:Nif3-like dinuclear metal center hexameric protein [Gracilinema caldarium]|uniref:Nif3-like dinuclear metal center hexameric protein n=1 Tax=Gracilinema caldarium TaxID=215591 RepID=UPI0026EBA623|nr:Nif3-like dinuclear metal center hexameric protein [Gracilinema caldarium]
MEIKVADIIRSLPGTDTLPSDTVDGILYGSLDVIVSGVAVTFLATANYCKRAQELGCNLVISHEGIWFSHRDQQPEQLIHSAIDQVYQRKRDLLQEHDLVIYRYHDGIHRALPDRITAGLVAELGWQDLIIREEPAYSIIELKTSLGELIQHIKNSLGLSYVRYIGSEKSTIRRVLIAVGYRGSGSLILPLIQREAIDLVIYGEGPEWEIPEHIRDANDFGINRSLIIIGHGASESPGIKLLTAELTDRFRSIPIRYLPFENPILIG